MDAAEAVLPEELVEVIEGVGSGHFVQALHPAPPARGAQPRLCPRLLAFVRRRCRRVVLHLQRLAAGEFGQLVKPAGKNRMVKVSPLRFERPLAFHCQNSREERHCLNFGKVHFAPAAAFYLVALSFAACFNLYKQHFSKLLLHEHQFTQTII